MKKQKIDARGFKALVFLTLVLAPMFFYLHWLAGVIFIAIIIGDVLAVVYGPSSVDTPIVWKPWFFYVDKIEKFVPAFKENYSDKKTACNWSSIECNDPNEAVHESYFLCQTANKPQRCS